MSLKAVKDIKNQIKSECEKSKKIVDWFYGTHLLAVEKCSQFLLQKFPQADKEVVMLGVWLHDLQRIRGINGDHQKIGAREAEKVMRKYGYDNNVIEKVKAIILTHSCSGKKPKTLEGKILATADAMSHYYNDFYLKVALTGERDIREYKKWALEKLNRDYNKKIFFVFAKKKIESRHNLYKKFFSQSN